MNTLEHIYMDIAAWSDMGIKYDTNHSESQTALENLESSLSRLDSLLSEFGSISRPSQDEHFETLSHAIEAMKHCRQELSDDITHYIDRKLRSRFNAINDVLATIDEKNISTPNSLGIDVNRYSLDLYGDRHYYREELESITMDDLLGTRVNTFGKVYDQTIPEIKGVLEEKYGYTALKINANPQVDKAEEFTYNDYVKDYYEVSEVPYVKEMTPAQKTKNAIWRATGIGYILDSVYGYSLINGDNLTQGEADARFVEGSLTTAFNILPAAVSKACGAGLLEATIVSMKEIEFNALWMASPSIGEEVGIPELSYLMRLCLVVGAVYDVGRVDDVWTAQKNTNENSNIVKFTNWDDMKEAYKGTVTKFVKNNKPLGATHPRDWLKKAGTSLTIELLDDGTQIWKYTKDGMTVSYVPKLVNNEMQNVIEFPNEYLHFDKDIAQFSIEGGFTGNRNLDKQLAIEYLKTEGYDTIPTGYILHHDIEDGVFQLVRKDVHETFSHYGGFYYNK